MRGFACAASLLFSASAMAQEPVGLHRLLDRLTTEGRYSGAVVIRDAKGVRFARGYGSADPFTGRAFTPDTPVDSGSLAKPVTAAAVLMLVRDGKIELDAPVQRYLPEFPYPSVTVGHLLAQSAGLPSEGALEPITGKTNRDFMIEMGTRQLPLSFPAGTGFTYCNFCYSTLALLVERISGQPYLKVVRERTKLPKGVTIRPARLADWAGRAIGYRRSADGQLARADSYENELFYGTANFSISAHQLARWGTEWWGRRLAAIRPVAIQSAVIAGKRSGLSWGNWYCAQSGRRCHYLGHHEGFHHMLYWNVDRKISLAMVTNNSMAPAMHQSLQRALVAYAEGARPTALEPALMEEEARPGVYRLASGELIQVTAQDRRRAVVRHGISYPAYAVGGGVRYVPGLDLYLAGDGAGCARFASLYDYSRGCLDKG